MTYSKEIKKYLLALARDAITKKMPEKKYDDVLCEKRGVFVTLEKKSSLRGCIGYVEAVKSVYESVVEMAKAAAFNDPRFNPVEENELPDITISITVLSPLRKIESIDEFELHRHGLVVSKGRNRGLLLPQVASEHNMDRDEFISHTCMKAGLSANAWKKEKLTYEVFEGEVFSEDDD